jgi:hypothetical protein
MEADAPFFSMPELVEGEKKRGWSGQRDGTAKPWRLAQMRLMLKVIGHCINN